MDAAVPEPPKIDVEKIKLQLADAAKLFKKRKAAAAIALTEKVLAVDRENAQAKKLLGDHYYKQCKRQLNQMKYKLAAENAKKAVSYQPQNADAWMRLGFSLVSLKRKGEAKFALKRYLELCPKCTWARFARKELVRLK